jgi:protein ImuB
VRAAARPAWAKARPAAPAAAALSPPGGARDAIGPLPAAALRLPAEVVEGLARLGLRTVADLAALPRGALARRFGAATLRRLDQALGAEPEPVGAGRPAPVFAARLSLPEPVGRTADVAAALDRLLTRVTARLAEHGSGARRLRLSLRRVDRSDAVAEVGLARPSRDARMIAGLFARRVEGLDAGFGIEALRLEAVETEPLSPLQHRGHLAAGAEAAACAAPGGGEAFGALLSRLGGRIGFERLERFLPADSHIPARAFTVASAAFAEAHAGPWPRPPGPRPLVLFDPEPVDPEPRDAGPRPPAAFRWRGRAHRVACAFGPERIAPEWWLDDPAWRSGPRDYWRIETEEGARLWLFHAPLSHRTDRWFMEGAFG